MPSLLLHKTSEGDTIGEGSVVQLIGFLIKPSSRTSGKGETVNCELPDREENDNHINIVKDTPPVEPTAKQLQDLECRSVVVESHPTSGQSRGNRLGKLVKTTANATAAEKIAARRSPPPHALHGPSVL